MLKGVPSLEKKVLGAALLVAASWMGFLAYAAVRLGITVPTCVTSVKPFDAGQIVAVGPGRYEAHVVAKMWQFDPDTITVPKGSTIDFYLTSADVVHGFFIRGTDVNLMAVPGAVNYARARFDAPGKYLVVCHEYCGVGHGQMAATVEVTP